MPKGSNNIDGNISHSTKENNKNFQKKYRKPLLILLGDLRTHTLGGSNTIDIDSLPTEGKDYVYIH